MASDEVTKVNRKITGQTAVATAYTGDAAGRNDISIQLGDASMELIRLNGAEGRKGK